MSLIQIGDQYINTEAIASVSRSQISVKEGLKTRAFIQMIGGGGITLYEQEAIAFTSHLDKITSYTFHDPRD